MSKNISEEDVHQVIKQVMHPEINHTLVELGMVKDTTLENNEVRLTLVLPLLNIPVAIKEYLMSSLRHVVTELGAKIEISVAEMNQEERMAFFTMEQAGWKG